MILLWEAFISVLEVRDARNFFQTVRVLEEDVWAQWFDS